MDRETVSGVVSVIGETQEFGSKGFRVRQIVIEQQQGDWVNYIPLEFTYEACDEADRLRQGDDITVEYELKGRKWQKDDQSDPKYFVSVRAISFEGGSQAVDTEEESQPEEKAPAAIDESKGGEDIPF